MKSMIRFSNRLMLLALATAVLAACDRDTRELDRYIAETKARPAQPIAPIPPVKTYKPYAYEGAKGRDPFRSSTSQGNEAEVTGEGDDSGPKPDFDRPKEYLERFELDTLTMVGTFSRDDAYWGLVRDPDGVVHRVNVGDYMGKNHGQIAAIGEPEIALSEFIPNGNGGWLVREASIALEGN